MKPITAFDRIAGDYDRTFTDTETGRRQRRQVRTYLESHLARGPLRILELNCGTGEDAVWLARQGHSVIATDISAAMIATASRKAGELHGLEFRQADIRAALTLPGEGYDLIFSNFGGLNCLSPEALRAAGTAAAKALRPGGRFVAVVMPRFCLWECLYFIAKMRFRSAFRRNTGRPVVVPLGGGAVQETWYYSPRGLRKLFAPVLSPEARAPIGFFLPPSYLDPFFAKRPRLLEWLDRREKRALRRGALAGFSDHYLVDFSPQTR